MTQLSLDDEPPSKFERKKEVKEENKNLLRLVFSVRNEKNKNKSKISKKNIEDKKTNNEKKQFSNENYSNLEKNFFEENNTSTLKNIFSSKPRSTTSDFTLNELNYFIKKDETVLQENENLYRIHPNYSFESSQTFIKENDKKDYWFSESKEHNDKINYLMYNFEEEANKVCLRWNATVCS